jgi:hypothetical protein
MSAFQREANNSAQLWPLLASGQIADRPDNLKHSQGIDPIYGKADVQEYLSAE